MSPARIDAPIVDAHTHTWSGEFGSDYAETMQRAWDSGLVAVIEVGGDVPTSELALAVAREDRRIHAVVGIHPHAARELPTQRARLEELVASGDFVAVGEIGLDFYRTLSPPNQQYEALRVQLDLARGADLPVVIHSRDADEECYGEIETWFRRVGRYLGPDREIGMMHCYAGDTELAERYRAMGFLISIPGPVTYPRNERGQDVARNTPLESLLVETDSPSLTPQSHRGKRNEPAYVVETIEKVAELRGCAPAEVANATAENAARLFSFELGGGA